MNLAATYLYVLEGALCAQVDTDLFFPEKGGSVREPKTVCAGCPVRAECLQVALELDVTEGVWGGTSAPERRRMQQERDGVQAA